MSELQQIASVPRIRFKFGEFGGNLNIEINNQFENFEDFQDIAGTTIGGVSVNVTNGFGQDAGTVELIGEIEQFRIGGQEFLLDDIEFGNASEIISNITFTELEPLQNSYRVGDTFTTTEGVNISVEEFVLDNGEVTNGSAYLRSGQELWVGNVNLNFNIESVINSSTQDNQPPEVTSPATTSVEENTLSVIIVQANDAENDSLTFSLSGGEDSFLFTINANTAELSFNEVPDFENPIDANQDNVYQVQLQVDDGNEGIVTQDLQVAVADVNEAPEFQDAPFSFDLDDPATFEETITAVDPEGATVTYDIVAGNGGGAFTIDANSGEITVADANALTDDFFNLTVEANDGVATSEATVNINVTEDETPVNTFNDLVFGTSQADNFDATDSSSPYTGDNQIVFSGQGDDTVNNIGAVGNNRIYASFENDLIIATQNDRVFGQDGGDEIIASTNNLIFAGNGNDIIEGTQVNGDNIFHGQGGDDQIFLGGFDRVFGGIGEDLIFVQAEGGNTITGGPDADDFWVATGGQLPNSLNIITDFTSGEDAIGFGGFPDLSFNDLIVNQNGENTIIGLEDNPSILELQGVQANTLTENDFVFAAQSPV